MEELFFVFITEGKNSSLSSSKGRAEKVVPFQNKALWACSHS